MKEAESLSGLDAVAADIIDLTKCMVEYEADAQDVVKYMVDGLTERSVFEFAKKNIASECEPTSLFSDNYFA